MPVTKRQANLVVARKKADHQNIAPKGEETN
jgi:hypothetical protein